MTDKNREDTILAIRISPEQRDKLEKAAEEALLKAVASYLE